MITPKWAAQVWTEGDLLYACLPTPDGKTKHTLTFPNDAKGLAHLLSLVKTRSSRSRLGEKGDITQYQLDKLLASKRKALLKQRKQKPERFTPTQRIVAKDILKRMRMI